MNENAKKWIKALESGEYKQAKEVLVEKVPKKEGGGFAFCCLGVACMLYNEAHKDSRHRLDKRTGKFKSHASQVLPNDVQVWLGLNTETGGYNGEGNTLFTNCLTEDNDAGKTFKQIARIIKKHKKELFPAE